jgi:ankyrin repeat protein
MSVEILLNEYENSALHEACKNNNIEILRRLLRRIRILRRLDHSNIDVNFQDEQQCTPLHISCQHNNIEAVKLLLNEKSQHNSIKVNLQNVYGETALHIACQHYNIELVKLLLSKDNILLFVDINLQDANNETPLDSLNSFDSNLVITRLRNEYFEYDDGLETSLQVTIGKAKNEIIQLLLHYKPKKLWIYSCKKIIAILFIQRTYMKKLYRPDIYFSRNIGIRKLELYSNWGQTD